MRKKQYKRNYKSKKYRAWKKVIYQRDSYICKMRGKSKLHVSAHHIYTWSKYPDFRYKFWNSVTLCIECHSKTFRHESEFESLFFNLLEQSLVKRINEIYHIKR